MTITRSEVLQLGMISKIHIRAANTKRAITRCCTTVKASMPKNDTGTAQRKMVMISTIGRATQYLKLNFLAIIDSFYFSYLKRMSTGMLSRPRETTSASMVGPTTQYFFTKARAASMSPRAWIRRISAPSVSMHSIVFS